MDTESIIDVRRKKGTCCLCGRKCRDDAILHGECAYALEELKKKRINKLLEKYGDGLRFEKILVNESDLK